MSIWVTKRGPGNRKSIFSISIAWQALPLIFLLLTAIVVSVIRWLR